MWHITQLYACAVLQCAVLCCAALCCVLQILLSKHCLAVAVQSSLKSEMQNVSFEHIDQFHHRHFPDMRHDFLTSHPQDFLKIVALDMAIEAAQPEFALNYTAKHQSRMYTATPACLVEQGSHASRRKLRRKKDSRTMPKHFYIDDWHRSDYDRGEICSSVFTCGC